MRSIVPFEVLETALKNAFERFYFLRKMADRSQAFLYNKTQPTNFFSENSIGFYSFTFEKYNSLAFKIIIRSFRMKKQILTGVLLSVLAVSSAYAQNDKKDAKKPELSSQLVAHKDKKDAKKPKFSTELVVAQNDKKDAKKPKNSVA